MFGDLDWLLNARFVSDSWVSCWTLRFHKLV